MVVASMGFFDFLKNKDLDKYPIHLVGFFKRIKDEKNSTLGWEFHKYRRAENLISEIWGLAQKNIFVSGMSGLSGKSTLLEALLNELTDPSECTKYVIDGKKMEPQNFIVFSPKYFDDDEPIDFDLGRGTLVDCSKQMINVFENVEAFVNSIQVMVNNSMNQQGITASQIAELAGTVVRLAPCNNWDDFRKNITTLRKSRDNVINIGQLNWLEDKIPYLDVKATVSDIPLQNCVFWLGKLSPRSRAFYYEAFLQKLARELNSKKVPKPVLLLDESHLVLSKEGSIVSTFLRELRTRVNAIFIASQNGDDVDPPLLQFSKMFVGKTLNTKPFDSKPHLNDCIKKLQDYQFIDFAYTESDIIPVYEVSRRYIEKLKIIKQQALEKRIEERKTQEKNTTVQNETKPEEESVKENLEERIIEVLEKSSVCMYRYQIGKAIGFNPKKAGLKVRTPLENLTNNKKIKKWTCQVRKEEVVYYYLSNDSRDVCHVFMMRETKKHFGEWKIVFEATQGKGHSDFIIEKNGKKIAIECETFLKKDTSDLRDRIAKNRLEGMETIIVIPTELARQFYSALFDSKVVLIPEVGEVLKKWT